MKTQFCFDYLVTSASLAQNAGAPLSIITDGDCEFELYCWFGSSTQDAASDNMPNNFTVQVQDTDTGRYFSNSVVPQRIWCGPSNRTLPERYAIILPKKTSIIFNVVNLNSSANIITVGMRGYKLLNT